MATHTNRRRTKAQRTRAAIYTRISRDHTGQAAGVQRQEDLCRKVAGERGLDVVAVYSDNDISAYSGKRRPGFEALMEAITDGGVDAVVVYHLDRLYRRGKDFQRYADACQPHDTPTYTVIAGDVDLTTPSGRMVARLAGTIAEYESEHKAERQRAANEQRARQGKHFGTRRCFGYEMDGVTIREPEAQAIREGFALILDGGSLREVARRWNGAGLPTPQKGNPWTGSVVRNTLRTHRLAGIKTYRGEVVRDDDGRPVEAEWPAIVDQDTWARTQAVLSESSRRTTPRYYSRLLLSGVALCDVCGSVIQSGGKRKGQARYRCSKKGGHVYRMATPIDEYVRKVLLYRLAREDRSLFKPSTTDTGRIREQIAEIHRVKDEMARAVGPGGITVSQLLSHNREADARLAELEAQIPSQTLAPLLVVRTSDIRKVWEGLTMDVQRSVIDSLMTIRLVPPGTKEHAYVTDSNGETGVNPDTVRITWKSGV